jgi:Lhr-like helicase
MASGAIEARLPVERPLDVLAQHLVTVALGGGFVPDELLAEVRSTRAYAELGDDEWAWALDFVASGGESLRSYPEYARLERENGRYVLTDREQARRHRMSIGTIVSDAQIVVQYLRGGVLGSVEESFVARLVPGARFFFAGTPLEFVRVRDMRVWVRRAPNTKGRSPLDGKPAAALRRARAAAACAARRGRRRSSIAVRARGAAATVGDPAKVVGDPARRRAASSSACIRATGGTCSSIPLEGRPGARGTRGAVRVPHVATAADLVRHVVERLGDRAALARRAAAR